MSGNQIMQVGISTPKMEPTTEIGCVVNFSELSTFLSGVVAIS